MSEELKKLKARYERLNLLQQVGTVIHSTLDPQEALQLIVREAVRVMNASSGSAVLLNPNTGFLEIHASQGLPAPALNLKLRLGEGLTGWVARTGKPARVGDVRSDRRYVMLRPEVRSELAVPLEVRGEVRGVLNVDSERSDAFDDDDQELLEALATQAARVIHNTWLYEQLRLQAGQFESLAAVSRTINSTLSLDEALDTITREACRLMRAKMCSLMLLDETRAWLDLRACSGAGEAYLRNPRLRVDESLLGTVVRRRKPVKLENIQSSGRYQRVDVARAEGLVSLLSVPLMFTGEVIGTLSVYTAQTYSFSNDEVRVLSAFAELSAIAIEKARLYERVVDVEEQLRQNEKLSALGLLAAEVAHEIRNPLTVMKMLYHSLNLKFPKGDPRTEDARVMGEKIEHLNKIVERILDFARTSEPDLKPVNLNQLVDELALLVRHKFAHAGVELRRELQPDLPAILGDATQLEQAFLNLMLNAAEAMSEGGTLTIRTRAGADEETVVVEFADTGEGMTDEQQQRVFKSLLSTTKAKGTGLGLAIVNRVIETHRGKIQIESRHGKGTQFTLTLPTPVHVTKRD
ncbi:MAG: GAF domain-containing protein [Verrucomicrobia bacterium]|nr:MAG: GAF domain-containing protein [Verrucomicrobiota bacterium]